VNLSDELRLRVHAEPFLRLALPAPSGRAAAHAGRLPSRLLVLDTETTTDATQRLLFGWYRYIRVRWRLGRPKLTVAEEGIFYADDLPALDPIGHGVLQSFAAAASADVGPGVPRAIRVLGLRAFLDVLFHAAVKGDATIVGFNLPFDLPRLASGVTPARARSRGPGRPPDRRFVGGHSLILWPYVDDAGVAQENRYRPRVRLKHRDSTASLMAFAATADRATSHGGQFLDLRTVVFALTDRGHSLESAGTAFGLEHPKLTAPPHGMITPDYVAYARRDVAATAELFAKVSGEFTRHPIARQITKAMSPATIGKGYLRAMGVRPILERQPDFPRDALGASMIAYYGGRAEVHVRRTPVQVVYLDFRSMYPTVNALLGLWALLTAERIDVIDATDDVRRLLADITLDGAFDPTVWPQFVGFALIQPYDDVLPARLSYDGTGNPQIGVNRVTTDEPVWWSIPDAIASALLTGRAPEVRSAIRLVSLGGQLEGLAPVRLRGIVSVDPVADDFFRRVVEERVATLGRTDLGAVERDRLARFLKVLANSTSYGIYAEVNAEPAIEMKTPVQVQGLDGPFVTAVDRPELTGEFYFPPLAAVITGAARLMLALVERSVTDRGGTWAIADTDSFAIVAAEASGPIAGLDSRALSWIEAEAIRESFASLNPYDRALVPGSILKLEDANFGLDGQQQPLYCFAISAKRYALFTLNALGDPVLVKWSEHGLGHLLNPTDPDSEDRSWMRTVWEILVRESLGRPMADPLWLDRPAITRTTVSSTELLRLFDTLNAGKAYADQVKPGNFLLSAATIPFGQPTDASPDRFDLVAPYTNDARQWLKLRWIDRYSGKTYRVTTSGSSGARGIARVQTYWDVIDAYRLHREAKSGDGDGAPSTESTVGELQRLHVQAKHIRYVGKESNRLEEVATGLLHALDEVSTEYVDPRRDRRYLEFVDWIRATPTAEAATAIGVNRSTVKRWKAGTMLPRPSHIAALARARDGF